MVRIFNLQGAGKRRSGITSRGTSVAETFKYHGAARGASSAFLNVLMQDLEHNLLRILIVDDEAAVRGLLAEVLGERYRCDVADSAEAALEMVVRSSYAVVVSDVEMSGISGIELVSRIRAISPDTVVLLISGSLTIESAARSAEAGAFDLITKPFDIDSIERSVGKAHEYHLSLRRGPSSSGFTLARMARTC